MPYTLTRKHSFTLLMAHILTESTAPPAIIASWPAPNYVDPETRGSGLIVLSILLIIITSIIIAIRIYTRLRITRAFGFDDAFAIIAYILGVALSTLVIIGNKYYYSGRHVWDIPPALFVPHRQYIWWGELLYILSTTSIKISVLLFYRRLSISFTKGLKRATWIGLAANLVYLCIFTVWLCLLCHPLNAYWDLYKPGWRQQPAQQLNPPSCLAENISLPVSSALSALTDLYATLVPLVLVMTIQKPFKQKIPLYALFSVGFLVVIFATLRAIYTYKLLNVNYDFTWILYDCWIYAELELQFAIIAASAPALRPLFNRATSAAHERGKRVSRAFQRPSTNNAAEPQICLVEHHKKEKEGKGEVVSQTTSRPVESPDPSAASASPRSWAQRPVSADRILEHGSRRIDNPHLTV